MSIIMFIIRFNVHYYERYVNLGDMGAPPILYPQIAATHRPPPRPKPLQKFLAMKYGITTG